MGVPTNTAGCQIVRSWMKLISMDERVQWFRKE